MLNMETTCRTCMKTGGDLVELFGSWKTEDEKMPQLSEILETLTATQVSKEDGLPQKLCEECVKTLRFMYEFRVQVLNSYEELKRIREAQADVKNENVEINLKSEDIFDYDFGYVDYLLDDYTKQETENKVHVCNECNNQYTDEKRLLKHLKTHEKTSLPCSICSKTFRKQSSLDRHLSKHSQCTACLNYFESDTALLEHMNQHENLEIVDVEIKTENEEMLYKCPECDATYTKYRSLAMHMKKHRQKKDKMTEKEDKTTVKQYKTTKKTDEIQKMEKSFKCDVCEKLFSLKTLLRRHMKLHSRERPYQCEKCDKSYSRQDQYNEHMKKHNGIKPNVCPHCSKAFSQLGSLKDHIRTHTGETPFLCSQCGKGFNNSSNLRQHVMRHTGLKPYACNLCPKRFSTKGQLTSHVSTHTGAHPYKCAECGSAFTKPNSLKKHQLIHLGLKPFACDTCTMRFSCKDHLKRHYRIHTGEKPYRCKYCDRAFTQSNDLAKHTRMHVGQNIYQCTQCDMRFRLLSELKQHYPTHYIANGEPPLVPVNKGETAPVLVLKPPETEKEPESTITITFSSNGLEKDGLHGNITIDITPQNA